MKSRVRILSDSKKLGPYELAKKTGLAVETVYRAMDDRIKSCKLETLEKIAEVLECQISDLYESSAE